MSLHKLVYECTLSSELRWPPLQGMHGVGGQHGSHSGSSSETPEGYLFLRLARPHLAAERDHRLDHLACP